MLSVYNELSLAHSDQIMIVMCEAQNPHALAHPLLVYSDRDDTMTTGLTLSKKEYSLLAHESRKICFDEVHYKKTKAE